MAQYHFFKHKNEWRYREKTEAAAKPVGTFALDSILGVTGTREVIVVLPKGEVDQYHVHIKNGFIQSVKSRTGVMDRQQYHCWAETEVHEFNVKGVVL